MRRSRFALRRVAALSAVAGVVVVGSLVALAAPAAADPVDPILGVTMDLTNAEGTSLFAPDTGVEGWAGGRTGLNEIDASVYASGAPELHNAVFTLSGPGADDAHPYSQSITSPATVIADYTQRVTFEAPLRRGAQTLTLTITSDNVAPLVVQGTIIGRAVSFGYSVQFENAAGHWVSAPDSGSLALPKGDTTQVRVRVTNHSDLPATVEGFNSYRGDVAAGLCTPMVLAVGASTTCAVSDAAFVVGDRTGVWRVDAHYETSVHDGSLTADPRLIAGSATGLAETGIDPRQGLTLSATLLAFGALALAVALARRDRSSELQR